VPGPAPAGPAPAGPAPPGPAPPGNTTTTPPPGNTTTTPPAGDTTPPPPPPADTTAPSVTIASPSADVDGRSPVVSGSAGTTATDTPSVTVRLTGGGTPQTLTAAVAANGTWSVTPAADLSPGAWTATAEQRDAAGNTGTSAARHFAISAVLLAAGDIAGCPDTAGAESTAQLLDGMAHDVVAPLGDQVYEDGTASEFANCYAPTWGRHKAESRPAVGNHEYNTASAAPYFTYFGAAAGDPSKGYYSYDLGTWHVVVLNSNCTFVSCSSTSAQADWLRSDLQANPSTCTLAYWHHPLFNSSWTGPAADVAPLWRILDDGGAELVLNGHAHDYERFARQDYTGAASSSGMREFIVGTGGAEPHFFTATFAANSDAHSDAGFGILKLTLRGTGYGWDFVPAAGGSFSDSGSAACS
jgi:acid phosphatase type 7